MALELRRQGKVVVLYHNDTAAAASLLYPSLISDSSLRLPVSSVTGGGGRSQWVASPASALRPRQALSRWGEPCPRGRCGLPRPARVGGELSLRRREEGGESEVRRRGGDGEVR